ncbi:AlkZ-related protein [Candidatus Pristimantibacillus sp. PTI5]|uniref:AlkZ-related protein n=1 Tax=Candidatus Pristimantibacillus sp. PTI5 TaxID=3400422 RepID=UPI003B01F057
MSITTYPEFVQLVGQYKIFPFSDLIPEHPSLTSVVPSDSWHTDTELDPWLWRVKIVKDEHAAYGKFFGTKASFIHVDLFPMIPMLLSQGKSVEERYSSGLLSQNARNIYRIIKEAGNIDSRNLRKESNLTAKEQKKDYERALVDLQNYADIVITGAQESDFEGGWSSMCFESSDHWLYETLSGAPEAPRHLAEAKAVAKAELGAVCTEKALKYLDKKLRFSL